MSRATCCLAVLACLTVWACGRTTPPAAPEADTAATSEKLAEPAAATSEALAGNAVHFAVIGDYGTLDSHEHHVAEMVQGWAAETRGLDFLITMGDNNYNSLSTVSYEEAVCQKSGDLYYGQFVNTSADPNQTVCTAAENIFFPTPGNHDWDSDHEYSLYTEFFPDAGTWDPDNQQYLQYTFGWPADNPVVQLFSINVNCSDADVGGDNTNDGNHGCPKVGSNDCSTQYADQKAWLEEQLAASSAPWNLVYFHQPPYSYAGNERDCVPVIEAFDWTGGEYVNGAGYGLTAVLSGHSHVYERIVRKDAENMPFLIVGASGKLDSCSDNVQPPPTVETAVCHSSHHGAARVRAGASEMTFEYYYKDGSLKDTCVWTHAAGSKTAKLACNDH